MTNVPLKPYSFASRLPAIAPMGAAQAAKKRQVIPLSFGSPHSDTFPYKPLIGAATDAIWTHGRESLQYGGAGGPGIVLDWVAQRSALRSIHIDASQVLMTYGSQQALDYVARALLDPGDHAWLEGPTYFGAVSTFRTAEAELTSFPIDENGLIVEEVERALQEAERLGRPMPKLLYTMPNFHNPGGISLSLERRQKLGELAYRYNFYILEDDAYTELSYNEQSLPAIYSFAPERTIYLSTFSKIIAPGIRLGWAIASQDTIARVNTFFQGSKASVFSQEIVAQLLTRLPFDEHLNQLNDLYRNNRDAMVEALKTHFGDDVTFSIPDGGFFIWLTFPEGVNTGEFVKDAEERGVSFIDGKQFYIDGGGARHARLSFSYCGKEQIREGVALLAQSYYSYLDNRHH
ncbi:PLP-dependent aminotransferase family protein [Paenibacillus sp. NPDC057967]|uniref:aminotransferase-like domain-containing protein n=1 Tax=Paenibacillus sp. NPDC057967 TaxID=3346293 RepID=UPI0036DF414A